LEVSGPAEFAGLKLGDKVLNIDNESFNLSVGNLHDRLVSYLRDKDKIYIDIKRSGEIMTIPISITNR